MTSCIHTDTESARTKPPTLTHATQPQSEQAVQAATAHRLRAFPSVGRINARGTNLPASRPSSPCSAPTTTAQCSVAWGAARLAPYPCSAVLTC